MGLRHISGLRKRNGGSSLLQVCVPLLVFAARIPKAGIVAPGPGGTYLRTSLSQIHERSAGAAVYTHTKGVGEHGEPC